MYLYKYKAREGTPKVKTAAQVKKRFILNDSQLTGFRRDHYVNPIKAGTEYQYWERDCLILESAVPEWRKGIKPCVAFPQAEVIYQRTAEAIFEAIAEYSESHNGFAPPEKRIEGLVTAADVGHHIEALVEEGRLGREGGGLRVLHVFQPPVGLTAYKTSLSNPRWWRVLSEEKRMSLQEVAFSAYLSGTLGLPDDQKVPVPVDTLLVSEGFAVSFKNLGTDSSYGYNDPAEKAIYVSDKIRKNRERVRLVKMHEYFHVRLNHGPGPCTELYEDLREAEATYAAVHFLIPMHSFDLVARRCLNGDPPFEEWMKRISRVYQLPVDVVSEYYHELLWRKRVIQAPSAQVAQL